MSGNTPGRTLNLDEELLEKLREAYKKVNTVDGSAMLCKIPKTWVRGWYESGKKYANEGRTDNLQIDFYLMIEELKAKRWQHAHEKIKEAEKNWQAHAWWLERTHRSQFGEDSELIQEMRNQINTLAERVSVMLDSESDIQQNESKQNDESSKASE